MDQKYVLREFNTQADGTPFSKETIEAVWDSARNDPWYPELKIDTCGATIAREYYGDAASNFGWEIDHIVPVSEGGTDDLTNLQALHWENNHHKGDRFPDWECKRR